MEARARGIDVNHYHPVHDWAAVTASGVSFIGVKATEGNTLTDAALKAHRDGARTQPFDLVVFYHFARSGRPETQAVRLLDAVGPLQANERLCLDLEVLPDDPGSVLAWVDAFYGRLRRANPGHRHLIYTSRRIWTQFGNPSWAGAADIDLWVPRYNAAGHEPELPAPWTSWTAWQWTDGDVVPFTCPGVGACDANVWNGDRATVRAWVAGTSALRSA